MKEDEYIYAGKVYVKRTFWQWLTRKPRRYSTFYWDETSTIEDNEGVIMPDSAPSSGRWIKQNIKLPWYKRIFKVKVEWFGAD